MEATQPIPEVPWHLEVNRVRTFAGTFTPGRAHDLAAGRLIAEGFVRVPQHLQVVDSRTEKSGAVRIEATIDPALEDRARATLRHRSENGCGLLHFVHCEPEELGPAPRAEMPTATEFARIMRGLFTACDERYPDGGVHAAALWDGQELRFQSEDVGRHNTVDRVLGAAFLSHAGPTGLGLVLSARISGQMALAAARAGVAWVASRSVPTSLAVAIADVARLPLVARAAREARVLGGGGL